CGLSCSRTRTTGEEGFVVPLALKNKLPNQLAGLTPMTASRRPPPLNWPDMILLTTGVLGGSHRRHLRKDLARGSPACAQSLCIAPTDGTDQEHNSKTPNSP